jgi:hypothetical protein
VGRPDYFQAQSQEEQDNDEQDRRGYQDKWHVFVLLVFSRRTATLGAAKRISKKGTPPPAGCQYNFSDLDYLRPF